MLGKPAGNLGFYSFYPQGCESSLQEFLFIPDCNGQKLAEAPRIQFLGALYFPI